MSKKISRRDFSRTAVAAGTAAVAIPAALLGAGTAEATVPLTSITTTAAKGAEAARRRRAAMPSPEFGYGGDLLSEARDSIALSYAQNPGQGQTGETIAGWRPGTTLPVEYYTSEAQYLKDEKFLIDNVWLMVDHESRVPKPGDYFVWEFGRGESVVILRDKAGAVRGFHNVCRHRASRLARHHRDPAPQDAAQLSVKQLGPTGNTPVFRCPYHAWTYDLDGKLISAPNGMPNDFDFSQNGLIPCHVRTSGGFIIANLSLDNPPPDFDSVVNPARKPNWVSVCEDYGTAKMKIAVRQYYPVRANWKLVMENFHECYHCGPAHKSLVTAHPFWDGTMPAERRTRIAKQVESYVPTKYREPERGGMGANQGSIFGVPAGAMLNVGFSTGSLDGKPVAPLVPTKTAYSHTRWSASTTWALGNIQCYDDYVAVVRHTPRDVNLTDVEIFWLVNAEAKEGRDYKPERVMALWDVTEREDRWIVENQMGLLSSAYKPGRYAVSEGASRFIQSYMREVVQGVKSL